jgi:hypothetical protein
VRAYRDTGQGNPAYTKKQNMVNFYLHKHGSTSQNELYLILDCLAEAINDAVVQSSFAIGVVRLVLKTRLHEVDGVL